MLYQILFDMEFFMVFSLKELSEIIGVNHNRARQWVAMGYLTPSVKKSAVKGSNNVFDRFDLYRAAILNHMIEFGWSRETVSMMISAVTDDQFWRVCHAWLTPDKIAFQAATFEAKQDAFLNKLVEALAERIPKRKIFLVFLLHLPISIHCVPLCENPPVINEKPLMGDISSVANLIKMANDAHIIEMTDILRKVDDSLYLRYPQAFEQEIQQVLNARKDSLPC
jgi:DNA-binding transcriptional MerR regulator